MKGIITKTRKAEEISQQIAHQVKALKGWNLISGMFYAGNEPEDIVIYALNSRTALPRSGMLWVARN